MPREVKMLPRGMVLLLQEWTRGWALTGIQHSGLSAQLKGMTPRLADSVTVARLGGHVHGPRRAVTCRGCGGQIQTTERSILVLEESTSGYGYVQRFIHADQCPEEG